MAIIKYIPKKVKIRDFRNDNGGYYEAKCDFCGRLYYPKKKSKYCSSNCMLLSYRQRVAEGQIVKPRSNKKEVSIKEVDNKVTIQAPGNQLIYKGSKVNLIDYMKKKFGITKVDSKLVFKDYLYNNGDGWFITDNLFIIRINQTKYELYKD